MHLYLHVGDATINVNLPKVLSMPVKLSSPIREVFRFRREVGDQVGIGGPSSRFSGEVEALGTTAVGTVVRRSSSISDDDPDPVL
jgi:hypothetical protein